MKDHGGWAAEVKFAPAYKDGDAPYDWWFANELLTTQTWVDWGDLYGRRRDMGGAILNLNDRGEKISYVVGWLGFHWGYSRDQYYHFLGYPAAPSPPYPSDGSKMFSCEGPATGPAWLIGGWGPELQKMGCDMGQGASGGPWITEFSPTPGQTDFLNGNGQSLNGLYPGEVLSPYFDDVADSLWACLLQGC